MISLTTEQLSLESNHNNSKLLVRLLGAGQFEVSGAAFSRAEVALDFHNEPRQVFFNLAVHAGGSGYRLALPHRLWQQPMRTTGGVDPAVILFLKFRSSIEQADSWHSD
jgi:hypothetical protein